MLRSRALAGACFRGRAQCLKTLAVVCPWQTPSLASLEPSHSFVRRGSALAELADDAPEIIYPREGPGVKYALNWGLAAAGVPPSGVVHRNLKAPALKAEGASPLPSKSGTPIFARGPHGAGTATIGKPQFNNLFKEVSKYLSSLPKLYVQDAAVGSVSTLSAKVRAIVDSPSAALALQGILEKTPTRVLNASDFPLTAFVVTSFSPSTASELGAAGSFVAVDYERQAIIIGGSAISDAEALKSAFSALATPTIVSQGALPLPGWVVSSGDATGIIMGPPAVASTVEGVVSGKDAGVAWDSAGIARFFPASPSSPSLYKAPSALIIVTSDSTGAIPLVTKLTPGQAAYHFLAGYEGEGFKPTCSFGPSATDPIAWASKLKDMVSATGVPAYLVNASQAGTELSSTISSILKGSPPAGKKPTEAAVKELMEKYTTFVSKTFPSLPEGISLQ